jgi:hypothetical protein
MDTNGSLTERIGECWISDRLEFYDGLTFLSSSNSGYVYDGKLSKAYYDMYGNLAIDFPEYNGIRNYDCGNFVDGYAVMSLEGADGKSYFTIIDKTGKQMFEPQTGYNRLTIFSGNYALAYLTENKYEEEHPYDPRYGGNVISVLNMKGETLLTIVGEKIKSMYMSLARDTDPYIISCGLLRLTGESVGDTKGDVYINIADGTVIGNNDFYSLSIIKH